MDAEGCKFANQSAIIWACLLGFQFANALSFDHVVGDSLVFGVWKLAQCTALNKQQI